MPHRGLLVLGFAVLIIGVALALCDAAGMTPIHVAESSLTSMDAIRARVGSRTPQTGVVLGSGLGARAGRIGRPGDGNGGG